MVSWVVDKNPTSFSKVAFAGGSMGFTDYTQILSLNFWHKASM